VFQWGRWLKLVFKSKKSYDSIAVFSLGTVSSFSLLKSNSFFARIPQYYRPHPTQYFTQLSWNADDNSQIQILQKQEEQNQMIGDNGIFCNTTETEIYGKKSHAWTVCIVPPESNTQLWEQLTKARTELRDPGLYRWPPHVNLLYPFLDDPNFDDVLSKLRNATARIHPFHVSTHRFGCFGGKNRGVLWLYPTSTFSLQEEAEDGEPIKLLQQYLQNEFPYCNDQQKKGEYCPHMTLSHFDNITEARKAQIQLEAWWGKNATSAMNDTYSTALEGFITSTTTFYVEEVYLLSRSGDNGQFKIAATIPLGCSASTRIFSTPRPFVHMPTEEEDWIRAERMKLKDRRNSNNKRGSHRHRRQDQPRKTADTPEVIAAKRMARKAKREEA